MSKQKVKWRGIPTNPTPRNEDKAKTIQNRLHQISFSLPRIDDKKRWAGYPGLSGISPRLAKMIPSCKTYVEALAGAARTYQELRRLDTKIQFFILNEKSPFILQWLRDNFHKDKTEVTELDFIECIRQYDSTETVFLFDLPWFITLYKQPFSWFDRESVKQYEIELLNELKTIQGKFFITTRIENIRMKHTSYHKYLIKTEYVVSGKYPETLVTSNIDISEKRLKDIGGIRKI